MRKVVFLTGTRADFGKIKSLMEALSAHEAFEVYLFVTGMHLMREYGLTLLEVERSNVSHIHTFQNHTSEETMDLTLSKTIEGLSEYIKEVNPDLIVVHGDRVEALAGAIVGSLNNILVGHIEGGEISGTIDELIRHSVSKLSHLHFVSNAMAKKRLVQLGELENSVFVIGSPDIDVMISNKLPKLAEVKEYYNIDFESYGIVMFHPVTTDAENSGKYAKVLVDTLIELQENYVVIFPNNDLGSSQILQEYKRLATLDYVKVFPSLRFEYFLTLLKNAKLIIGNSSAGIREAPFYGVPSINIGDRQKNRADADSIIHVSCEFKPIAEAISKVSDTSFEAFADFGIGQSSQLFLDILLSQQTWDIDRQKQFVDVEFQPNTSSID